MKKTAVFKNLSSDRIGTSAEEVATRLRDMIHSGELSSGDRLPPERDLAKILGVSRPTLRAGIRSLSAVGILQSKQGAGTFVSADESPTLDSSPLRMLSDLHGISSDEMVEARLALETSIAGLAARRVTSEQITTLAEEIAQMYASLNDPDQYLIHDRRFHQVVAEASGNRIISALRNMVAAILSEYQGNTLMWGTDLEESAERHHNIYRALRDQDAQAAEKAMHDHLVEAQKAQRTEVEREANGGSVNGSKS